MIQVSKLTKQFGERILFEDVTFNLIAGERLGLVGRNGSGKSTLFKLILGDEHPDEGTITTPKGYRIGHLAQHLTFTEPSVLKEACLGLPEHERDEEYRGEIILNGLGFSGDDVHRAPSEFSGGFQIRINLAKLLLSEPNLLLLDEPTNYLDIVSMRWLTEFLRDWRGEMILISHDRLFMDSVTTHTMFIHRGAIRKVKGPTSKLYEQVAQDEANYEKNRIAEEKKRKELEEFIARFRAQAAKAALVQSKIKMLEKLGQKEELASISELDFRFTSASFPGKQMVDVRELSFRYPNGPSLIEGLNLAVNKGDRIAVIGKNGRGKSTFLRLLAGELVPTGGTVTKSQNATVGYFGQTNIQRLDPKLTVEDEIYSVNQRMPRTQVRAICGTMLFSGDDALKKISVLSGGEKSRVLLGKILAAPSNLLLLDEPTNHLDMESIQALIESLRSYEGAVFIVTHSELILRELANRLVVFQFGKPYLFDHDYGYFLEKEGWGEETGMSESRVVADERSQSHEPRKIPDAKLAERLRRKITAAEESVVKREQEHKEIEAQIAAAYQRGEPKVAAELLPRAEALKRSIEEGFAEFERLTAELRAVSS
ncbi:MAG: ATP-binding cassette domain-containing protein [Proteobacteria bacterium]|nr:ATP-binding cassette domain-containing protein [Pseudomonadota bacterium]